MLRRRQLVVRLGLGLAVTALTLTGAGACKRSDPTNGEPVTLDSLEAGDKAKASGKTLMALPFGLHHLDTTTPAPTTAVIGVHGYDSKGYEWVYPLKTTGDSSTQVYFYRWDYGNCPEPMAALLDQTIDTLLTEQPELTELRLLAHSYGGVISALVAARYDGRVPLTVDIVASPLAGAPTMKTLCDYAGPTAPGADAKVTLRQWRTIHAQDNALKDIDPDPQVVDLPGEVTRLPETYEGHRLGHNWSISWVVDHLAGGAKP